MTILNHLPRSNRLNFDLPFGAIEARLVMVFERDVSDREFVCAAGFEGAGQEANFRIGELSFSETLKRSFVYVPKLAAGVEFRSKLFKVPMAASRLSAEILPWSDKSASVQKLLRGFAIELSTTELPMPTGWGRLLLPGKESLLEQR